MLEEIGGQAREYGDKIKNLVLGAPQAVMPLLALTAVNAAVLWGASRLGKGEHKR